MASYAQVYNQVGGGDAATNQRVTVACIDVALDVMADAGASAASKAYAQRVLANPDSEARPVAFGVGLKAAGTTDAQLKAAVVAIWAAYAGG